MKILLIGASGRTGRAVLTEALRRGHQVTALVRDPGRLADCSHPNLTVVAGNLLQPATLAAAVPGHAAALLVAGTVGGKGMMPLATGTAKLIWELEVANVPRLIVLSRQGAGASRQQMS
ncbi:MAG: NAD(P)H-binding protein, partial [Hymenobacteraceae bacterium]|nr:NAD(P)H-binding protein [Hymenobacteraceae bacterium]